MADVPSRDGPSGRPWAFGRCLQPSRPPLRSPLLKWPAPGSQPPCVPGHPSPGGAGRSLPATGARGHLAADGAAMVSRSVLAALVLLGNSRSRSHLETSKQQSSLIFSAVIELHKGGRDGGAVFFFFWRCSILNSCLKVCSVLENEN